MNIITNHFSYESVGESIPLTNQKVLLHEYFITSRSLSYITNDLSVNYYLTHTHGVQTLDNCLMNTANSVLVLLKHASRKKKKNWLDT